MSKELLELKWDAPHRLAVFYRHGWRVIDLEVNKDKKQKIPDIHIPDDISVDTISAAWAFQGGKWIQLHVFKEPYFVAGRAIYFREQKKMFFWSLMHFKNMPFDLAGFVDIEPEEFDELVRLTSQPS